MRFSQHTRHSFEAGVVLGIKAHYQSIEACGCCTEIPSKQLAEVVYEKLLIWKGGDVITSKARIGNEIVIVP